MSRLVLHIGTFKTGTTHLQVFMRRNQEQLAAHGVAYPAFTKDKNHIEFFVASYGAVSEFHERRGVHNDADIHEYRKALVNQLRPLAKSPLQTTIVSSEYLTFVEAESDLEALRTMLLSVYDQVDILMFLRRPDYLAGSVYGESVIAGMTLGPGSEYVDLHVQTFDGAALVSRWERVFGADQVTALPYLESYKKSELAVVKLVLNELGIDFDSTQWNHVASSVNPSSSELAIAYLRLLNPETPKLMADGRSNQWQRRLLRNELSARFPGPSAAVPQETMDEILRRFPPSSTAEFVQSRQRREDAAWADWLAQEPAAARPAPVVTPEQLAALKAELYEPAGPLVPGGRPKPKPAAAGISRRLYRKARRLRRIARG